MNLHHSDACQCPRPFDSGRTYYTYRPGRAMSPAELVASLPGETP